jgi:hypothetical protein
MREFRDYLHIRHAEGIRFKRAAADLESVFSESFPNEGKLILSPALVSRTHRGDDTVKDPTLRERISKAIGLFFAKQGLKGSLDQILSDKLSDPNLGRKIERLRKSFSSVLQTVPRSQKVVSTSGDNSSALFGVYHQINFTHIDPTKVQVRLGLKLIYSLDGNVEVVSLGRTIYWAGRAYISQRYLHVTETAVDRIGAECASYVFDCTGVLTAIFSSADELKPVHGLIQVVSHQKHRHMFSGRCLLVKDQKLTREFSGDHTRFIADRERLQRERVKILDLDSVADLSVGKYSLRKIIDEYLSEEGEKKLDIPSRFI